MHDVFSSPLRQAILYCLQSHERRVSVTAIARQVVTWQRGGDVDAQVEATPVRETRLRKLRSHVVAMVKFGIVGYDPETDDVWLPNDVSITVTPP